VPSPPAASIRPWHLATGIAIALAGHAPASGLWLVSFFTFIFYPGADSMSAADCCVLVMQPVLFIGCVVPGVRLVRRGDRGIGLGLLSGWATGIFVLVGATGLITAFAFAVS
jgi:hypothetical protein